MRRAIAFGQALAGLACAGLAAAWAPPPPASATKAQPDPPPEQDMSLQAPPVSTACRADTFPLEQRAFGLSKVRSGPPVHLAADLIGCPNATPACRQPPYAVPEDMVITGRPRGGYVCVFRPHARGGGGAGWMPGARLAPLRLSPTPPMRAWIGHWRDGKNSIDIAQDGDALAGVGRAVWPSVYPLPAAKAGDHHFAKFSAQSRPQANRIEFRNGADNDQTACLVSLVLVDRFLVAEDNAKCGGMNVTFTGVYQRR